MALAKHLAPCHNFLSFENTWHILILLFHLFTFLKRCHFHQVYLSYKRGIKFSSSKKKHDQVVLKFLREKKRIIRYIKVLDKWDNKILNTATSDAKWDWSLLPVAQPSVISMHTPLCHPCIYCTQCGAALCPLMHMMWHCPLSSYAHSVVQLSISLAHCVA